MQLVKAYLDTAVGSNLNVMRIWAQTVGFNRAPFQTSPGVYNENIFRGLDYALDQARQRNIKVGCTSCSVAWSQRCLVYCLLHFFPVEPFEVFSYWPACLPFPLCLPIKPLQKVLASWPPSFNPLPVPN